MAQGKLWIDRRSAISQGLIAIILPMTGCAHRQPSVGLSLLFLNRGTRPLTTKRFDFDGKRGPDPGYLSPKGEGAYMGFMPGDRKGGIPQSVEVEWIIYSPEFIAWSDNIAESEQYSEKNKETHKTLWATNRQYFQRVDLTSILTPDIVAKVLSDRENTQLKMTVIFRDDKVDISAEPYKWR